MRRSLFFLNFVVLFLVFGCVLFINQVLAWTEPISVPPQNNVAAPLNTSFDPQSKAGSLSLLSEANPSADYGLTVLRGKRAAIHTEGFNGGGVVDINATPTAIGALNRDADSICGVYVSSNHSFAGVCSHNSGGSLWSGYFENSSDAGGGLYGKAAGSGSGLMAISMLGQGATIQGTTQGLTVTSTGANSTGAVINGKLIGLQVQSTSNNASIIATNTVFKTDVNFPSVLTNPQTPALKFNNYGLLSEVLAAGGTYPIAVSGRYDASNYGELGQAGIGVYGKGATYAGKFDGPVKITGATNVTGALTVTNHCVGCTAADIAESLAQRETVSAGDIVAITGDLRLFKATKVDLTVVGVVSSNPFLTLNEKKDGAPLALSGIVPAKVTAENGAIKAGDFITASSIPGFGMKATAPGTVVGKALQDFSGKEGKINILVNISYFLGLNCQK